MQPIAITKISLAWLTTCLTYYVMAAPMKGIGEVPLKAGCPCGHDAEKIQPLVIKDSPSLVVAEDRNVIASGCKGGHDHDHHHGPTPIVANSPTPPPTPQEKPTTNGSCASGCDHHDGPVVIPSGPTPPILNEMPSTQSACGSGSGHDHGPVIVGASDPHSHGKSSEGQSKNVSEAPKAGGCCHDHHHGH
ncbi:hypothetical protein PGT21_013811 [Puccinia graminis f. sp. tritici]|uniref:Uncharacterized protein n=1 Tax=Puccinia graminis f. sp. tritici TaxID=56615 RepID=A0A5B0NJB6_PUCGR|nr:hypothetical protein PGT21_013811 [Puccinia graminis f. sp. tritici]KAA1088028.1 hypothetical protein PGTUg99_020657 [Puccinia graminis f. sp. tritici]